MKRANKHQMNKINVPPLVGGINVALLPEQIADNEMQICENFLYDSAILKGRQGLSSVYSFESDIISMYYDFDMNCTFVFLKNREAFMVVASTGTPQVTPIGSVTGDEKPQCCKFHNKLFIASGGYLQYYDYEGGTSVVTLLNSQICNRVFYRFARLAVCRTGSDNIYYSATGDATSDTAWVEDTNDDSSSKWLEIGYADSGDIVEIVPLATDMIVFKSNAKAYQLVGDADFNTWQVYNIANFTDITQDFAQGICATNLGNEVVFLSLRGLRSMAATQDYGNIATADIGDRFNDLLTAHLYEPELWNFRRSKMLVIRPTESKRYFVVYNYSINAATTWTFKDDITCFCETKDDIFVGAGNKLYVFSDSTTDNGDAIDYRIVTKDLASSDEILVKAIDTKFSADYAGVANVRLDERLAVNMPTNDRRKVKCNHSSPLLHVDITSNHRFAIDHISLDVVDL